MPWHREVSGNPDNRTKVTIQITDLEHFLLASDHTARYRVFDIESHSQ